MRALCQLATWCMDQGLLSEEQIVALKEQGFIKPIPAPYLEDEWIYFEPEPPLLAREVDPEDQWLSRRSGKIFYDDRGMPKNRCWWKELRRKQKVHAEKTRMEVVES